MTQKTIDEINEEFRNKLKDSKEPFKDETLLKAQELLELYAPYVDWRECDIFTERQNMLKNAKHCVQIHIGGIIGVLNDIEKTETGHISGGLGQNEWIDILAAVKKIETL